MRRQCKGLNSRNRTVCLVVCAYRMKKYHLVAGSGAQVDHGSFDQPQTTSWDLFMGSSQ